MNLPGILAAGLVCPAGPNLHEASRAFANGERFLRQERKLIGADGFPITIAAVIAPEAERDHFTRVYGLFEDAFMDCMVQLAAKGIRQAAPLILLLSPVMRSEAGEAWLRAAIAERLAERVSSVRFYYGGSAEGLALLAENDTEFCYLAAMDSLISADLIDHLMITGRLFSSDNPWGTIPGEGAVVLALGHGPKPVARIVAGAEEIETEQPDDADRGILGKALAKSMKQVAAGQVPDRLLADLDGSRSAVEEFGFAVTATGPSVAALADRVQTLQPQIGQPGAAAGLILVALACQGNGPALICATSPTGRRGCVMLQPGEVMP